MAAVRHLRRAWRMAPLPDVSLRGMAGVVPKVTQVDNSSDFLGNVHHRKHPGVVHLRPVCLPPELIEATKLLMAGSSMRNVEEQAKALTNYLWSRKRPTEETELLKKARYFEQKLRGEVAPPEDLPSELDQGKQKELEREVLTAVRKTTYHWVALNYTEELSFLYMAARMDGMYAAVSRAFHEIEKRVPNFQPSTLLDFGSGTGTVSWAAHNIWGKTLTEYMNIDSSSAMLALAERLMKGASQDQDLRFSGVYFRQFLPVSPKVKFDLVVSAFSLNDLPSYSERVKTIQTLWRKTNSFLVLVENGTKEGHQMLMEARAVILKGTDKVVHDPREPHIFAPCPHHLPCPRLSSDRPLPCNFIQAYHPLPFRWKPQLKEERFSFLILCREAGEANEPWPRITQPVLCRSRHVHVHLCCPDGTLQHVCISPGNHGRDLYRCAKASNCGDRLPVLTLEGKPDLEEQTELGDKEQS
ncbi:methyltransferase-like protein 17, mitochondrial [Heteronotia binoei]|uniref:methyltransferase-like protein 17, mitochondrial n=1 Tax=Heteronotia binoei TaxID=13085 RepID=UPI00292FED13|nr:methyltransferase-like protein 17, mitochondrial [Heteronotia binoei]